MVKRCCTARQSYDERGDADVAAMKVLILGAGGMLGHALLRLFRDTPGLDARGAVRSEQARAGLPADLRSSVTSCVDLADPDRVVDLMAFERPEVVINCAGLAKQRDA